MRLGCALPQGGSVHPFKRDARPGMLQEVAANLAVFRACDYDELAQITVGQPVQHASQHGLTPDRHHGLASCEREWVEAFSTAGR